MEQEKFDQLYEILNRITITEENRDRVEKTKQNLLDGNYMVALDDMEKLLEEDKKNTFKKDKSEEEYEEDKYDKEDDNTDKEEKINSIYPKELINRDLENSYITLLLDDPKLIARYYFIYDDCRFDSDELLNIYKSILFTEGGRYTPEIAKDNFNFSRADEKTNQLKIELRNKVENINSSIEEIYIKLGKLFVLRKKYLEIPIKDLQDKIVEITHYQLYDKMSLEEVKSAIIQVTATAKFKQSILNEGLTEFLEKGNNNLTNGLELPFPILSKVFKGIRKGETMAVAMPSNSGKSRFTTNLASQVAFLHKKKVLVISNEMSAEKMKLCLITTILNNSNIQQLHKHKMKKTEGEILEFKFRPDDGKKVEVDKEGFIIKGEKESQKDFLKRLISVSTEFKNTIEITDWINKEMKNAIYFINITDHTNDELQKVIMNYYYKEKIEYIFYDTLKTDTANIGNGEEIKRTATILSNLAQNFNLFICSTLQLAENSTLPINLDINDLAVSRTVKEVLDTLCLMKQINRDNYNQYEYSLQEVDTKFYDLKKYDDPDVRYYVCVVDKNRAGAKPKVLFRLNLAYNSWEELGYVRLKQDKK